MSLCVSVTGLRLNSVLRYPQFWWHAVRSYEAAKRADGILSVDTKTIDGIHHTRSVWRDRTSLRAYVYSGVHKSAIKRFSQIATGSVCTLDLDAVPEWPEVRRLWEQHGREINHK